MPNDQFYEVKGKKNQRQLTIVGVALLVSKPPTKEKRCRIKVRMILNSKSNAGAPEWLDSAFVYVGQHHQTVTPPEEFRGYQLEFSADNLFGPKRTKSPKCQMRAFEVSEFGERENPDVACTFTIYTPWSGKLWNWLGQFGGEEVWCSFTPGTDDDEKEDHASKDEDEEEEEEKEKPKTGKSGPKELKAFHEQQQAKPN
jgi:hypothetical protein